MGSQEVRNRIAAEVKLMRRVNRTADKIGNLVCKRIATPKRSNDVAHFESGQCVLSIDDGKRMTKLPDSAKVAPNPTAGMMKTAPRANGNFQSRYVTRRDIELSVSDREEIRSVVRSILALSLEPDNYIVIQGDRVEVPHWRRGDKLAKGTWRVIFRAAREALGMHKIMSREVSYDFQGGAGLDVAIDLACDDLEETVEEQARDLGIRQKAEYFRQCARASFEADNSRKRVAGFKGMMAFIDLVEGNCLGLSGHSLSSIENAHDWRKRFEAYIARGEQAMRLQPDSVKVELETAFAERAIE